MNTVTLIGTLTRDPELKDGQTKVCRMRLAESNGSKKSDSPLFIDVAAFGRQAETCQQYLSKGRQVAVSGRLRFREWEEEGGGKRSAHSVLADRVQFLGAGKEGLKGGSKAPEGEEDEQY